MEILLGLACLGLVWLIVVFGLEDLFAVKVSDRYVRMGLGLILIPVVGLLLIFGGL